MLNKQWNYVDFRNYNNRYIPKTSGIYLFARAKKNVQVPIGLEIIYIGKSKNLKIDLDITQITENLESKEKFTIKI